MASNDSIYITAIGYLSCKTMHNAVQWLIFTKPTTGRTNELDIGATDGFDGLFQQRFTWAKIRSISGEKESNESVQKKFRQAFQKSQIQLRTMGVKLQVIVGPDEQCIFELYETPSAEVRLEIQRYLFALAGRFMEINNELQLAKDLDAGTSGDVDSDRGNAVSQKKPRIDFSKTSVINPGTRRRKPAKGIVYD